MKQFICSLGGSKIQNGPSYF